MDVTMVFGVSQVVATLGLSLFVLGYGKLILRHIYIGSYQKEQAK